MVTTNDDGSASLTRSLRDHGSARADAVADEEDPFLLSDFPRVGFNYRMTDIQGALGCAQMDRLDEILARRREIAARYDELLAGLRRARDADVPDGYVHGYQAYVCLFRPEEPVLENVERLHRARNDLMRGLEHAGIADAPGHARAGAHRLLRAEVRPAAGAVPERVRRRSPLARAAALPADDRGRAGDGRRRALRARSLASDAAMCGIAGIVNLDGRPVDRAVVERMTAAIAHRGPDGTGTHVDGAVGLGNRRLAIIDLVAGAAPADGDRRRRLRRSRTTARSTTSASCAPSSSGSGTASARAPTPRSCCDAYAEWGRALRRALQRHVRVRDLGPARARELFLARDRYGVKPLYYADVGDALPLRARRSRRFLEHPRLPRDVEPAAPARVLHVPEHLHRRHAVRRASSLLPPGRTLTVSTATARGASRAVLGLRLRASRRRRRRPTRSTRRSSTASSARRSSGSSSADVPVGAYLSGGMDSGSHHRARRASRCPTSRRSPAASTSRSASGLELGFDERAQGRGDVVPASRPSTTRWCSRPATWSAACPRSSGTSRICASARATRTTTSRGWPASSSRSCSRAPAATSSSPATRGATTAPSSTTTSTTTSRSTTASGSGSCPNGVHAASSSAPDVWREVDGRCARSTSSATRSPDHAPAASARGVRQPLALLRGEDVPARPAARRGQAEHGARPRDARAVPRQRPRRLRAAAAGPAEARATSSDVVRLERERARAKTQRYFEQTRDGKLLLRAGDGAATSRDDVTDQVKQGFSAPDASWFRGESIDYVRERAAATDDALMYEFLEPTAVRAARRRPPRAAARTAGCCSGRCSISSSGAGRSSSTGRPAGSRTADGCAGVGGLTVLQTLAVSSRPSSATRRSPRSSSSRMSSGGARRAMCRACSGTSTRGPDAACARRRAGDARLPRCPAPCRTGAVDGDPFPGRLRGRTRVPVGASGLRHRRALRRIVRCSARRRSPPRAAAAAKGAAQGRRPAARLRRFACRAARATCCSSTQLSTEQPAYARAEGARLRDLEYVLGNADVVVSGSDWVDSMPWWDRLSPLPYAVDVDEWKPDASERLAGRPSCSTSADGEPRGTEFLVRACDGDPWICASSTRRTRTNGGG